MRNNLLLLTLFIASPAYSDFVTEDMDGSIYEVFDASVQESKDAKDSVMFYLRETVLRSEGKSRSHLSQILFNCRTKHYSRRINEQFSFGNTQWTSDESIGRTLGDYACSKVSFNERSNKKEDEPRASQSELQN